MKIESIEILSYRGIPKLQLDFVEGVNALVGVNGAGKSAVLDCIAITLSRLIGRIRSSTGTGRFFSVSDISNDARMTQSMISLCVQGETIHWKVTKTFAAQQWYNSMGWSRKFGMYGHRINTSHPSQVGRVICDNQLRPWRRMPQMFSVPATGQADEILDNP